MGVAEIPDEYRRRKPEDTDGQILQQGTTEGKHVAPRCRPHRRAHRAVTLWPEVAGFSGSTNADG